MQSLNIGKFVCSRGIFVQRPIVQQELKVQRRLGGRASTESGRIIAPSFEKSYCRTMRQVIDRHRTIERGKRDISKATHASAEAKP
ncbi:hypothetical protein ANTQUA_LOCUS10317 [Anthophora quadrimaculata]